MYYNADIHRQNTQAHKLLTLSLDLEIIITFSANMFAGKDMLSLLIDLQNKFKKCQAFDNQNGVLKIKEMLSSFDVNEVYFCPMIVSENKSNQSTGDSDFLFQNKIDEVINDKVNGEKAE